MRRLSLVTGLGLALAACGGSDSKEPLFPERAECEGQSIAPLSGKHQMVISFLEVGSLEDGFDLDKDGMPDNKLAGVGTLAKGAIDDSFEQFDIVIPLEFFDANDAVGTDECIKFAIYLGAYKLDLDGDQRETASDDGDCNDHDENINKDATEVVGNFKDDDCDGLADELEEVVQGDAGTMIVETPSDDVEDRDGDGVTLAAGDCDDTDDTVYPGAPEICSDGLDNDCDGFADFGDDGSGNPACSPYDATADALALDPLAFNADGTPVVAFSAGSVIDQGGRFELEAGPSIFSVGIPVTDDLTLELRISGATIFGDLVETPGGWAIMNGRLGGVIDANTADKIRGLEVDEIGLSPEDSLLDATYANILGPLLGLQAINVDFEGTTLECRAPDIDVDQDGIEVFCDSDPLDEVTKVDICVDGNGDIVADEVDAQGNIITECTQVTDADGKLRFVDGISVELNFETVPTILPTELPPLQ